MDDQLMLIKAGYIDIDSWDMQPSRATLLEFLDKKWDMLVVNNTISAKFAIDNPQFNWDWRTISQYADLDDIKAHPELPWDYKFLSWNENITIEFILSCPDKWNYIRLSSHMPIDIMDKYNLPWVWSNTSRCNGLTWQYVFDHSYDWTFHMLYMSLPTTLADVEKYNLKYFTVMSRNPLLDFEVVLKYPEGWNWVDLSYNQPWKVIFDNLNKPWDIDTLSKRDDITWDIVCKYPNLPWSFAMLSRNLPLAVIKANSNKPWDYFQMSWNTDLDWIFILQNRHKLKNHMIRINTFEKSRRRKLVGRIIVKWRQIISRRKREHAAIFMPVMDHLRMWARDRNAGKLKNWKYRVAIN